MTEKRLDNVIFSIDKIQILDPNKAHGQDEINICILKIFDNSICKSLGTVYKEWLSLDLFPLEWKK